MYILQKTQIFFKKEIFFFDLVLKQMNNLTRLISLKMIITFYIKQNLQVLIKFKKHVKVICFSMDYCKVNSLQAIWDVSIQYVLTFTKKSFFKKMNDLV